jgi:hypothetical protein
MPVYDGKTTTKKDPTDDADGGRGGIRFGGTGGGDGGDAYAGEVGYTTIANGSNEYVTELVDIDEDDDDDNHDEGRAAASHPSTLLRQMVRNESFSSLIPPKVFDRTDKRPILMMHCRFVCHDFGKRLYFVDWTQSYLTRTFFPFFLFSSRWKNPRVSLPKIKMQNLCKNVLV